MQNNENNDNEMNMEEEDDTMENDNYQYTGDSTNDTKASGETCQDWKSEQGYGGSCFQHLQADGWVMDY